VPHVGGVAERLLRVAAAADVGARSHQASGGTYGSPRLQHELRRRGFPIGRNRVMRLMRHEALCGRPRRRFRRTTARDPQAAPAPNLLAQRFTVAKPNTVWAADITALPTREGWLYLAVLLDLYSRRVVGWALDRQLETRLVMTAWRRALALRRGGITPIAARNTLAPPISASWRRTASAAV